MKQRERERERERDWYEMKPRVEEAKKAYHTLVRKSGIKDYIECVRVDAM